MEENPVQEVPSPEEPQLKRFFGLGAENTKWVLLFLLILLSLAGGLFLNLRGSTTKPQQKAQDNTTRKSEFIAPNSIVYGYWTKENSIISVLDLSTNQNNVLATLPLNIKHVKILDPKKIIYIKDTDERDYGKEIVVRALDLKTETIILKADEGFGIDDYAISPNSRYLAVWEVSPPQGSVQLLGGRSRVYTLDILNSRQKNLIYDETSGPGITVAYPIAITDNKELFTDRFLPNSSVGWGYGMAVSDFSGTNKQDIGSLTNGVISTQPIVSKDGKKLLFVGYDGRKGPGTIELGGYRRAILSSNTIEIFDLSTRQKQTLLSAGNDEIFPDASWDLLNGNIIYKLVGKDDSKSGTYVYDLRTNISSKINLENNTDASVLNSPTAIHIVASISQDQFLVFDEVVSDSALGNLGSKYNQSVSSMYIIDVATQTKKMLNQGAGLTQFIALEPESYFSSLNLSENSSSLSGRTRNQLQLQTFELKPSLAPKRTKQQNENKVGDKCRDVITAQCNELNNTSYSPNEALRRRPKTELDTPFDTCFRKLWDDRSKVGACSDSPLYLYGAKGQKTTIYIGTPVYSSNANYSPVEGFAVTLGENGSFIANGTKVSSLKFDYEPAIRIEKPNRGYLITKDKVPNVVEKISDQLGLNEKETEDTLNFIREKATSSYIFISLYDNETSKQILPLVISPIPDTYRNIVFYVENIDENLSVSYAQPIVEKIQRKGFTAIEISFVVR